MRAMVESTRSRIPLLAIIGRPNVGKSTLFNRIVQQRKAIVDKTPGVTRDRVYAESEWAGFLFSVVDTAGLPGWDESPHSRGDGDPTLEALVREQVMVAVSEADLILFVVDGREGLFPQEKEIANALRKSKKPVLLVVNKVDNPDRAPELSAPFFELGLGTPVCISAEHGLNVGDLLDEVKHILAEKQGASSALAGARVRDEDRSAGLFEEGDVASVVSPQDRERIRVAIVGKPNVGKSSLFNAIVGENRALVHSEPGTTRDIVDASLKIGEDVFTFVDTAGLRRRSRVEDPIERYSAIRTLRSVRSADVVLLLIDPLEGTTDQDKRIAGLTEQAGKGLVIAANKWDRVRELLACDGSKERRLGSLLDEARRNLESAVRSALYFVDYAPFLVISAKTGHNIRPLIAKLKEVWLEHGRRLKTKEVNDLIKLAVRLRPPSVAQGRSGRTAIKYGVQVAIRPPVFELHSPRPDEIDPSYVRYIESMFRQHAGFVGTPLRFRLRSDS